MRNKEVLVDKIYLAYNRVPECNMARFIRKSQFQAAYEDIRSALSLTSDQTTYLTKPKQELEPDKAYYADRTFHGGKTSNYSRTRSTYSKGQNEKKCFVYGKTGC